MWVEPSDIKINASRKRFRKAFGDVDKLASSIKDLGLINPITVERLEEPIDGKHFLLVAGERRLRACCMLGWKKIPATLKEDSSKLSIKRMELEENVRRKDLTWPEQVEALKQLDEIQREIHGSSVQGSPDSTGWNTEKMAEMVGASKGTVSKDLQLADYMRKHPEEVKKLASVPKTIASRIVSRSLAAKEIEAAVASLANRPELLFEEGSCLDLLPYVQNESVHCVLTDPPFAKDQILAVRPSGKDGSVGTGHALVQPENIGDPKELRRVHKKLWPMMYDKLVPGAHLYIFFGIQDYDFLTGILIDAGFWVDSVPMIWDKGTATQVQNNFYTYMSSYEPILFAKKPPKDRLLSKPCRNVFNIPPIPPVKRVHLLQRPAELLQIFIENSTCVGETIIDPFAGSGSALKEAMRLGRYAIGFERSHDNFIRARDWLNDDSA